MRCHFRPESALLHRTSCVTLTLTTRLAQKSFFPMISCHNGTFRSATNSGVLATSTRQISCNFVNYISTYPAGRSRTDWVHTRQRAPRHTELSTVSLPTSSRCVCVDEIHGRKNRSGRPGGCRSNNLTNKTVYVRIISTFVNVK